MVGAGKEIGPWFGELVGMAEVSMEGSTLLLRYWGDDVEAFDGVLICGTRVGLLFGLELVVGDCDLLSLVSVGMGLKIGCRDPSGIPLDEGCIVTLSRRPVGIFVGTVGRCDGANSLSTGGVMGYFSVSVVGKRTGLDLVGVTGASPAVGLDGAVESLPPLVGSDVGDWICCSNGLLLRNGIATGVVELVGAPVSKVNSSSLLVGRAVWKRGNVVGTKGSTLGPVLGARLSLGLGISRHAHTENVGSKEW